MVSYLIVKVFIARVKDNVVDRVLTGEAASISYSELITTASGAHNESRLYFSTGRVSDITNLGN